MRALYLVPILLSVLLSNCSEESPADTNSPAIDVLTSSSANVSSGNGAMNSEEQAIRPAQDQLSQLEAIARKTRVSNVSYDLDIDLVSIADSYQGQVILRFDLDDKSSALDIDFTGGDIIGVTANGEAIEVNYNGFFIQLPTAALEQGSNIVAIDYSHPYDQDGTGLHRFVDPEDGNTYLYTYLWPYYSNRLFPNFDQPNLKATYELKVRAANDWQVISSTTESSVETLGDAKLWHFPKSEKFSSYIFSLHAGPYKIWEDMAGDVPIRLMARQSLAQYVAVDEWMGYTKSGIEHYNDYFEIPYPFKKYDQVIVPDFLIGAMENVAAVTFSESYVDRGSSNRFSSQRRAGTILHEMAHMWFGDLVTMNWWNGLWLNESFATLMSSIAVSEATEFDDLWHDFYLSENLTAISADKAVSTHPIEVPVLSSNDFFNVFDAITYDKGASVLNQLSHYIGRENFRLGVSNYLKQHSWENTELSDFMDALSQQSGIDLSPWAQDWMYQAGVNTLEAKFSCEANLISDLSILQTAPASHPTLRSQRVQLGLFSRDGQGSFSAFAVLPIQVSGAETIVEEAVGLACPQLTLPNYEGWGYAEVTLDEKSMSTIISDNALEDISDPLMRSMVWTALFEAPSNGQMDNNQLLALLITNMPFEANDRIIRQTLSQLMSNLNRLERLGETSSFQLSTYSSSAENQLWNLISRGVIEGANAQSESTLNIRLSYFRDIARSETALNNLEGLLSGTVEVPGLSIGQGARWEIINRLAQRDYPNVRSIISGEQEQDSSDAGRRAYFAAQSALPNLETKQTWVERILDTENPLPLSNQRAAMSSLFPPGQEELQLALLPRLTNDLPALAAEKDNYYLQSYGRDLFAGICSEEGLEIIEQAISEPSAIGATLFRFMSENAQSAELCVAQKSN